jgi:methylated-DNA-protein-cysteine methyltransferase-like protein
MAEPAPFREAVLEAVARVPAGSVATYGQIAWMVGYPRRPRQVGMVLKGLPEGSDLPWHRIVNARGYVPSRGRWWGAMLQIERLRAEGVEVDDQGNLDLQAWLWRGAGD